jgi:hypothetical protein
MLRTSFLVVLLITTLSCSFIVKGGGNEEVAKFLTCTDLEYIYSNPELLEHFQIGNEFDGSVSLVDTLQVIQCENFSFVRNASIDVSNKLLPEVSKGYKSTKLIKSHEDLFHMILRAEWTDSKVTILIWQANDNANVELVYDKEGDQKIIIIKKGVY